MVFFPFVIQNLSLDTDPATGRVLRVFQKQVYQALIPLQFCHPELAIQREVFGCGIDVLTQ